MHTTLPPRASTPPTGAAALAAATPASRDRYVDLLRAASLLVVVLGHWLMAAVEHRDGAVGGGNLLQLQPATQLLTWAFQVMPIFFLVGGYSNAASWQAARSHGRSYGDWLHGRLARLTGPAVALVATWTVVAALAGRLGLAGGSFGTASRLVALPLWFLAVYVLIVAAAPAALVLHRRFGARAAVALAALALVVDVAHWELHVPAVGWANFAVVWLFAHQLGILWWGGRLGGRWTPAALAAAGIAALVVLTAAFDYPVSMVGGPGSGRTNNSPPSFALVALAVWQAGAVLALAPAARRWLARPKVWTAVIAANGLAMTLYLWHLTALAVAAVAVLPAGWFPQPAIGSAGWWALRPAWFLVLAAVLAPLVLVFARFERQPGAARPASTDSRVALAGTVLVATGFGALAATGFSAPSLPAGVAWPALVPFAGGIALLRARAGRPTLGHGR